MEAKNTKKTLHRNIKKASFSLIKAMKTVNECT